ncbi:hypothetical protein JTB14_000513 [Gonioctena quinquepunctata]|nr:hypothetical protein JTB14_000513 [Gonioctena quinquepunctata]
MGSSLSPIIANIYMEWFEELAIREAEYKPKLWLRYVDDTFILWNHGDEHLQDFFSGINRIRDSIKFTMEMETNSALPFLDVNVERIGNEIRTSVYRKKTHTGQYLSYCSNHPSSTKRGIVRTLVERATHICNDVESLDAELNHIREDLHRNVYPKKLLEEVLKQLRRTKTSEEQQQSTVICLPYIRGVSEKIRRIGNKFNIKSCFQSGSTLRSFLTKTKPDNKNEISKNSM